MRTEIDFAERLSIRYMIYFLIGGLLDKLNALSRCADERDFSHEIDMLGNLLSEIRGGNADMIHRRGGEP